MEAFGITANVFLLHGKTTVELSRIAMNEKGALYMSTEGVE
jgi:hypothetical protein